jgi:hypothetical protein
MKGIYTGISTASVDSRGEFFGAPGSFDLECTRLLSKNSQKTRGEVNFIAEFKVLTSTHPNNRPDSDGTYVEKFSRQKALGNIKGLILALLGLSHIDDASRIEAEIGPIWEGLMDRVDSEDNPLGGYYVHLETKLITVNKGRADEGPFTVHDFKPFDYVGNGLAKPDPWQTIREIMGRHVAPAFPQRGAPPGRTLSPDGRYYLSPTNTWLPV